MAWIYPADGPAPCTKESREAEVYEKLRDLPAKYVVVHSYPIQVERDGEFELAEIDFVVFDKDKGLLTIEVKAGRNVEFFGEDCARPGKNEGFFGQTRRAFDCLQTKLKQWDEETSGEHRYGFCKMNYAVWFLDFSGAELDRSCLTNEYARKCVLSSDDLEDPLPAIERVLSLDRKDGSYHKMDDDQARLFLNEFLIPSNLKSEGPEVLNDSLEGRFFKLTANQKRVLEYLRLEKNACVTGVGGSGKSVVAMERARNLSRHGRHVLYLCYNRRFADRVREKLAAERNVTVRTVDNLTTLLIDYGSAGFSSLEEWEAEQPEGIDRYVKAEELVSGVRRMREEGADAGPGVKRADELLGFSDLIVDEAQDFGTPDSKEVLLLALKELVGDGSTYLFYDELQVEPGNRMLDVSEFAQCRLALYRNCRNTREIAECGLAALRDADIKGIRPQQPLNAPLGHRPTVLFTDSQAELSKAIRESIDRYKSIGIPDEEITILTCRSFETTAIKNHWETRNGLSYFERGGVRFETVRKFKGLESDAVILVDVDISVWSETGEEADDFAGSLFYIGATRARKELTVISGMSDKDCEWVMKQLGERAKKAKKGRPGLAARLGAEPSSK